MLGFRKASELLGDDAWRLPLTPTLGRPTDDLTESQQRDVDDVLDMTASQLCDEDLLPTPPARGRGTIHEKNLMARKREQTQAEKRTGVCQRPPPCGLGDASLSKPNAEAKPKPKANAKPKPNPKPNPKPCCLGDASLVPVTPTLGRPPDDLTLTPTLGGATDDLTESQQRDVDDVLNMTASQLGDE